MSIATANNELKVHFSGVPKTVKPKPVFKTQAEYRAFADKFYDEMAPALREDEKIRRKSIERAKEHFIH